LQISDSDVQISDFAGYCREIETYLCRKNDGHVIRVVGPSFDLVSGWAAKGVPIKVAYEGIDRCFERYYRKGLRRRPVKVDFCEADVLDVFDEWRRSTGVVADPESPVSHPGPDAQRASLPAHLERVVRRLTSARVTGSLGAEFDVLIDRMSAELDASREKAGGVRGGARQALLDRLAGLDRELLQQARRALDDDARAMFERDADAELAPFRDGMTGEAFARAREAALDRHVRGRFGLPTVSFT
jgi:hypothetical protein